MKCYVFAAGEHFDSRIKPEPDDLVIAADGGYDELLRLGIEPNVVIGDFDSVTNRPDTDKVVKLNPIKNETDTYEAVMLGIKNGYTEFHIYGATGGRIAHTMANIQTLVMLANRNMHGYIYLKDEVMTVIHSGTILFSEDASGYISVFSLDSKCSGVNETGLKYTLDNYTLTNTFPVGVSNEFTGTEAKISCHDGNLLIVCDIESIKHARYN